MQGELIKDMVVAKYATTTLHGAITGKQYWGVATASIFAESEQPNYRKRYWGVAL
jgi:hypothetical protein